MAAGARARLEAVEKGSLEKAPGTSGIERFLAFQGDGVAILRAHGAPGMTSGWHHHGDHDVYGFVVSGRMRFEGGPGGRDAIEVGPGDFFHVPARMVHRDVNPSDTEGQVGVLCMVGTGPPVVNVAGPESE